MNQRFDIVLQEKHFKLKLIFCVYVCFYKKIKTTGSTCQKKHHHLIPKEVFLQDANEMLSLWINGIWVTTYFTHEYTNQPRSCRQLWNGKLSAWFISYIQSIIYWSKNQMSFLIARVKWCFHSLLLNKYLRTWISKQTWNESVSKRKAEKCSWNNSFRGTQINKQTSWVFQEHSEGFTCSACVKAQGRWPKEAISNWQQLCWSNSASPWGWGWTTSWIWENRNDSVVIHSWFILLVRCTIWTTQQLLLQHSPAWLNSAQAAWLNCTDQMADVLQHCTGGKKRVTHLGSILH